ncbi:MAG: helix-turn-helix domain-containing protein [Gammaproteobacteria bacterium]|nr:helix-turn-helix domain-containing protein [Gammaproteobacteria bacterium]MCH9744561.1 helix-turn-helix domain-containing protein [Gammaproteobacteria bacterium]
MNAEHTTKKSVFDDLGFSSGEAKNLKMRAALMRSLEKYIDNHKLKQHQAAKVLGISQPQVSNLLRGKIGQFSIDQLVKMHERVKITIALIIDDRLIL